MSTASLSASAFSDPGVPGGGTRTALARATDLAASGLPGPERLNRVLGEGWTGDEALAIAACCALVAPTLAAGLLAAVNHSGDSDSTGSITGNLLGAVHGPDAIPEDWLDCLEGRSLVEQVAADFATELLDPPRELTEPPTPVWWQADFVGFGQHAGNQLHPARQACPTAARRTSLWSETSAPKLPIRHPRVNPCPSVLARSDSKWPRRRARGATLRSARSSIPLLSP